MPANSPYVYFSREQWRQYRSDTSLMLTEQELQQLRGFNESISLKEVEDIYLPLSRLLNLYVVASQQLHQISGQFLGDPTARVPYIIGICGSVAVGKSTTSRILQTLLSSWPNHPHVDLVTTDGFLYPNKVLEERHLMDRKGFPESFQTRKLMQFLVDVKSGQPAVGVPLYSHEKYDIVTDETKTVRQPDILIIEGLNILQTQSRHGLPGYERTFISDFLDFSIYVDAPTTVIETWFLARFMAFRQAAQHRPDVFFHHFNKMSDDAAYAYARQVWADINAANLATHILPYKHRARLILNKNEDHSISHVALRKS